MAPQTGNPPALPPTVEEAYRRKCIQLKQRTKEIEEENDAYRTRLSRLKRQIQKTRLERAFLLEQIQKRTSANVEDSEGSPSPPPTEKPMRTKRGHRKPSLMANIDSSTAPGATFINQNLTTLSPSSDAFSRSRDDFPTSSGRGTNGVGKKPKRPSNAFEIYCRDMRPVLQAENKEKIAAGEFRLEEELARGWKDLPDDEKQEFQSRFEKELAKYKEERAKFKRGAREAEKAERNETPAQDEDVDMADTDPETEAEAEGDGGDRDD